MSDEVKIHHRTYFLCNKNADIHIEPKIPTLYNFKTSKNYEKPRQVQNSAYLHLYSSASSFKLCLWSCSAVKSGRYLPLFVRCKRNTLVVCTCSLQNLVLRCNYRAVALWSHSSSATTCAVHQHKCHPHLGTPQPHTPFHLPKLRGHDAYRNTTYHPPNLQEKNTFRISTSRSKTKQASKLDWCTPTNTKMEQDDCNSTGIPNAILFPDPITPTHPLTPVLATHKWKR